MIFRINISETMLGEISFKCRLKVQNLGEPINREAGEWNPSVTPDSKYLFFGRTIRKQIDIYWVDAKVIEKLRPRWIKQ